jgi:hypothetical protein
MWLDGDERLETTKSFRLVMVSGEGSNPGIMAIASGACILIVDIIGVFIYFKYYGYHRYEKEGIFGLFDSKKGPKTPHNKTIDNVASKFIETADCHPELDTQELLEVLDCLSQQKPSVATAQRILQSKGMNRPKGRRSKKTMKKKRTTVQAYKKVLKK